jgi:hypothetical protein
MLKLSYSEEKEEEEVIDRGKRGGKQDTIDDAPTGSKIWRNKLQGSSRARAWLLES